MRACFASWLSIGSSSALLEPPAKDFRPPGRPRQVVRRRWPLAAALHLGADEALEVRIEGLAVGEDPLAHRKGVLPPQRQHPLLRGEPGVEAEREVLGGAVVQDVMLEDEAEPVAVTVDKPAVVTPADPRSLDSGALLL